MTVELLKKLNLILPEMIRYLHSIGQLTPVGELFDTQNIVIENGKTIKFWGFPEPQPDFAAIEVSQGFLTYLSNQKVIAERQQATDRLDTDDRRFIQMLLKELNRNRKQWTDLKTAIAAATTLADLKTRVATLGNMPQISIQDIKAAMNSEDA